MPRRLALCTLLLCVPLAASRADSFPRFDAQEIDPRVGNVCYAVTVADVDGDGKTDVVAVTEDAVVWYRNPTWTRQDIVRGRTEKDNVCIQPQDIDGDGRIDFALGAGWRPPDTKNPSTLQWLGRDAAGAWQIHPIRFDEPSMHRIRWGDVLGKGRPQLVVAPLQGKDTQGPDWGKGKGSRVIVYSIPADPTRPDWPFEVASASLHTVHNIQLVDLDGDSQAEILAACWEGVHVLDRRPIGTWEGVHIGAGNQTSSPNKGASEVKVGHLRDGRPYLATIEPWHGTQVVVYTPAQGSAYPAPVVLRMPWTRQVLAEPLQWGHAVWTANLDDDADDEIVIGQRDPNAAGVLPKGPGVFVFDPKPTDKGLTFERHTIDDGGMACEDALAADLDGDGRVDIVAGGRATHNVKIYWNRGPGR